MLQAIEAEISPDGRVTLLEPIHLTETVRAVVTLLAPLPDPIPPRRRLGVAKGQFELPASIDASNTEIEAMFYGDKKL